MKKTDVRKGVTKRTAVLKNRRVTISDKFLLEYHAKPMGYQRREFDSITCYLNCAPRRLMKKKRYRTINPYFVTQ